MMAYIRLEDLQKFPIRLNHYDKEHGDRNFVIGVESVIKYAECLPRFAIKKRKHGEWVKGSYEFDYKCTVCGGEAPLKDDGKGYGWHISSHRTKYCPHCGAKMDGGKK